MGQPSILVNNAGIGASHTIINTSPEHLNKIFGVNLFSHWYTCQAFLPDMIKHDKGHVVTVASTASFVALPNIADYAATKTGALAFHEGILWHHTPCIVATAHSFTGLTQELRHRHGAPNVHTTVVHPSWTSTALIAHHAEELERHYGPLLTPASVGNSILEQIFACRGNQLILPKPHSFLSGFRGLPNWMQEKFRDNASKARMGDGTRL